ncbi:hypothetical protein D5R81_19960, partial [Parashewanella spongiae]
SDLSDVDALDDIPDAEFFDAVETKQPDAKEFEVHAREVRQAPVTPTSPTTTATSPLDGLPVMECQPLQYNATGDFWYANGTLGVPLNVEVPNSDCLVFSMLRGHPSSSYSWCSGPSRHEDNFVHNFNIKCTNGQLGRAIRGFAGLGPTAYSPRPLPYTCCSSKYIRNGHAYSNPWGWCNPNEPSTQLPYPAGVTPDPYIIFNPTSQPATTPPPATPPRATTPPPTEATSPLDGLPVRVCQPLQYNEQYDFWYGVRNSSNIPVEVPNSECMLQTIDSPIDPYPYCCFGPAASAEFGTVPKNVRCTSGKLGRGNNFGATCASYPSRVVRNPQGHRPPYEDNCGSKYTRSRGYRNGNPWGSCNPDEPGTQKPFPENVTPDPDIITQAPTTTSPSTTVRVTTPAPTEARTTPRVTTPPPTEAETTQETTTAALTEAETTQEATTPAPTEAETTQEATTPAPTEAETTQEATTPAPTEAETTQEATTPPSTEARTTPRATTPPSTEARTTVRVTTPPPTEARTTVRVTTPPPTKARTTPRATTPA